MNKQEFKERFKEFWEWSSNRERSESSWFLSLEEYATMEYNRAVKKEKAAKEQEG